MKHFEDDLTPSDLYTEEELEQKRYFEELEDLENSIPSAAERNRSMR